MTDLVARLREAIDETERIAREAGTAWTLDEYLDREDGPQLLLMFDDRGMAGIGWQADDALRPPQARHIVRHDPAAVLRRCAADRRIMGEHLPYDDTNRCGTCADIDSAGIWRSDPLPCRTLQLLAEAYGVEA